MKFDELLVGYIIKSKQVGPGLLDRTAIRLEGIGTDTREELTATVSETLVEVGMEIITHIPVFAYHLNGGLVDGKFIEKTVTLSSLVVCLGEIAYCHTLATMLSPYPVGIRKIYTYSR